MDKIFCIFDKETFGRDGRKIVNDVIYTGYRPHGKDFWFANTNDISRTLYESVGCPEGIEDLTYGVVHKTDFGRDVKHRLYTSGNTMAMLYF